MISEQVLDGCSKLEREIREEIKIYLLRQLVSIEASRLIVEPEQILCFHLKLDLLHVLSTAGRRH